MWSTVSSSFALQPNKERGCVRLLNFLACSNSRDSLLIGTTTQRRFACFVTCHVRTQHTHNSWPVRCDAAIGQRRAAWAALLRLLSFTLGSLLAVYAIRVFFDFSLQNHDIQIHPCCCCLRRRLRRRLRRLRRLLLAFCFHVFTIHISAHTSWLFCRSFETYYFSLGSLF